MSYFNVFINIEFFVIRQMLNQLKPRGVEAFLLVRIKTVNRRVLLR